MDLQAQDQDDRHGRNPPSDDRMNAGKAAMELIPLGPVPGMIVSIVAANIQGLLGLAVDIRAAGPEPDYAYLPIRRQYDAARIIETLAAAAGGAPLKLGLVQKDLCLPILTYVYGESQLGGKAAVVSLHRLMHASRPLIYRRAVKVSLHEVGHLLGLAHCREIDCLMRFSKQLEQLDRLPITFCSACRYEIERRA